MFVTNQSIPQDIQDKIRNKVKECINIINSHFNTYYVLPIVTYEVTNKGAGYAYLEQWRVDLNKKILLQHKDHFIDNVLPHEISHLVCYRLYGREYSKNNKPIYHGKNWRKIMKIFDVDANSYHSYDVTSFRKRKVTKYIYQCTKCLTELEFDIKRHKKHQMYGIYSHTECKAPLCYRRSETLHPNK